MRILKFTFAIFFLSFFAISFAQDNPYLVIEDNNGQYDVFLKIDDMQDVASVDVVGTYTSNGKSSDLAVNIGANGMSNFKNNVALIHSLSKEVSSSEASYMVLLTNAAGEVTSYPLVTVSLSAPLQFASNL